MIHPRSAHKQEGTRRNMSNCLGMSHFRFLLVAFIWAQQGHCSQTVPPVEGGNVVNVLDMPLEYVQARVCGHECRNGTVHESQYCANLECFPCDCEESCAALGTCCPTYHEDTDSYSYPYSTDPDTDTNPSRWYGLLDCYKPAMFGRGFYLSVVKCPESWKNESVRDQCETPSLDSLESVIPISDRKTRLVFANHFCLVCNGYKLSEDSKSDNEYKNENHNYDNDEDESKNKHGNYLNNTNAILPWNIKIGCKHFQNLYNKTDMFDFYNTAHKLLSECEVEYEEPTNETWGPRKCRQSLQTATAVYTNSNNSTEDKLAARCRDLPPLPSLVVFGRKNVFCAMKYDDVELDFSSCSNKWRQSIVIDSIYTSEIPPIYILFSPRLEGGWGNTGTQRDGCTLGHWRDEEGVCNKAICSAGKTLGEDDDVTCATAIPQIVGLGYNVRLVLRPTGSLSLHSPERVWPIQQAVDRRLNGMNATVYTLTSSHVHDCSISSSYSSSSSSPFSSSTFSSSSPSSSSSFFSTTTTTTTTNTEAARDVPSDDVTILHLKEIRVSGFIVAPTTISRDEFEEYLENYLLKSPWEIAVLRENNTHEVMLFEVTFAGTDMVSLYELYAGSVQSPNKQISDTEAECVENVFRKINQLDFYNPRVNTILGDRDKFIDINPTLNCPYVEIQPERISFATNGRMLSFTVTLHGEKTDVEPGTGVAFVDGMIHMCLDKFYTQRKPQDSLIMTTIYYLEIICTCVSVLCLVVSLVTLSLFKSLRSLPGLNNMCLCICLATAQVSLLVSAVFREEMPDALCLTNGILVHYSWLATFSWLNTCCIHMYRVFTGTRGPGAYSERKTHLCYCIYSFGVPALVVMATAAVSLVITNGERTGYSAQMCFLDTTLSSLLSIFTLLVPFGAAMTVNAVLFGLTVREIAHVTRLQQRHVQSPSKQGVVTYIKLSTITGLFLVLAAAGVLSRQPVLTLLATPLTALQGLFIFLSFIVNETVWKLYKDLLPVCATFTGHSGTTSASVTINSSGKTACTDTASSATHNARY